MRAMMFAMAWGEVFAVAAGILVVILDEIFEHLREEVVPLRERVGEAEVNQRAD